MVSHNFRAPNPGETWDLNKNKNKNPHPKISVRGLDVSLFKQTKNKNADILLVKGS